MKIGKSIIKGINDIVAACPYTIMGRKVLGRKEAISDKCQTIATLQEQLIIRKVKLGRSIILIGVFCPFFWISLISGASRDIMCFNAIHSGIVIALGYVIMIRGRIDLSRCRKNNENH